MFDICWHYFNDLVYLKEKKKISRLYLEPERKVLDPYPSPLCYSLSD